MRRLGLVARFAILSALLIGVLGVVLARSIETGIRNRNLASARQTAVLVSRLGVQPRLTPGQLARGLSPAEIVSPLSATSRLLPSNSMSSTASLPLARVLGLAPGWL